MTDINNIDLKKEIDEIKELTGEERGEDLKYLANYIEENEENGLERVKNRLKELDYETPDIEGIDGMSWIPVSLVNIFFVTCVEEFQWSKADIIRIGQGSIGFKYLTKLYIKYFSSAEKTLQKGAAGWHNHYSYGNLKIVEFEKKKVILRLEDFKMHRFTLIYFVGVFSKVLEMTIGIKIDLKDIKYSSIDEYSHEYIFEW